MHNFIELTRLSSGYPVLICIEHITSVQKLGGCNAVINLGVDSVETKEPYNKVLDMMRYRAIIHQGQALP